MIKERLKTIEADITRLALDAIVNAANSRLSPGGGVDGAIRKAAGAEMNAALSRIAVCAPGTAIITPRYRPLAKNVIHSVAPTLDRGLKRMEQEDTLAAYYENVLRQDLTSKQIAHGDTVRYVSFAANQPP